MGKHKPTIYELSFYDGHGAEIQSGEGPYYQLLSDDEAREDQFVSMQIAAGASAYSVHLLRPEEVSQRLKDERRQGRAENRQALYDEMIKRVVGEYALQQLIDLNLSHKVNNE